MTFPKSMQSVTLGNFDVTRSSVLFGFLESRWQSRARRNPAFGRYLLAVELGDVEEPDLWTAVGEPIRVLIWAVQTMASATTPLGCRRWARCSCADRLSTPSAPKLARFLRFWNETRDRPFDELHRMLLLFQGFVLALDSFALLSHVRGDPQSSAAFYSILPIHLEV